MATVNSTATSTATDRPERQIFRYHDGTRERGIDPIRALRELAADPQFNPSTHPELAQNSDPKIAMPALTILLAAVRRVFGLTEWSMDDAGVESGLTDEETVAMFGVFGEFTDHVKKNGSPGPTSPEPTAPTPCEDSATTPASTNAA